MKRYSVVAVVLLVLVMCMFFSSVATAQSPEIAVFVGDEWLELDVPPVIQEGRTLVPMRAILEALGAFVHWEAGEQKVTASKEGLKLEMWVGKPQAMVNGVEAMMDVPPRIIDGRTLIPLRFVSENLGEQVTWAPDLYAVGINVDPADIMPEQPFREPSIAGVRLGMTRAEVEAILGPPSEVNRYYDDFFFEGYVLEMFYPFGQFSFFESEGRNYLYTGELSGSDRAGGPRNVRVGDAVEDVLRKFPDHDKREEADYRVLYGTYQHLQPFGVVHFDNNKNPETIMFSTEDYYGFTVKIENGRVESLWVLMQIN